MPHQVVIASLASIQPSKYKILNVFAHHKIIESMKKSTGASQMNIVATLNTTMVKTTALIVNSIVDPVIPSLENATNA